MSAITAKASRKMKKYAVLTREPRCFLGSFDFSWEQRKLGELVDVCSGRDYKHLSEGTIPVYGTGGYMLSVNDALSYDRDAIGIGRKGTIDRPYILKAPFWTVDTLFYAIPREKADLNFAFDIFQNIDWKKKDESTGVPSLSKTAINDIDVLAPKHGEQQTIGQFFAAIDHLITLHQRKCVFLFGFFQAFISMIFTASTFSWEQRKVSDLAEKTYGGGTPTTSNEAYWNGDIPWIQSSDVVDGKLLGVEPRKWITQDGLNNSAAQLIPGNSIAIITRVGVGKLAFMPYSYATSQDFLSLSKLNAEPLFTVYACYKKLQSELNAVQGTSIKGITKDELLAKNIMVPRYAEQQQIGAFFKQLDNLITLHQRECISFTARAGRRILTANKKRNTSSWEQRKVGEVSESYSGGTPSVGVKEYYGGQIPFIRSAEINSEITELFLTEEGLKNSSARLVAVGDILYALYGATSGEVGRARLKGAINQAILAIKPHTDYDSEYLAQWLRKSKHSIIETYLQGGQGNLSGTIVKELSVDFPSLKEQKAIGDFFRQLDNLITLHQRKPFLMKWRTSDANRNQTNRLVL